MLMAKGFADDIGGIFGPDEGCWVGVPVVNEGLDVADEGRDGVERAAANGLSCEDAEPGLDHVEPGSAFGCEVKADVRVSGEPGLDSGSRVSRRVIQDDVEFSASVDSVDAAKKTQEVGAVVSFRAVADDFSGRDLQSGEEAGDPISAVVVGLSCGQTRTDRQHWLSAAESLDLSFFVDAEHDRIGGRVEIETDDVVDLLLSLSISGELEGLGAMRLKGMGLPDPMNRAVRHARALRHVARGPLGRTGAGWLECQGHDTGSLTSRDLGWPTGAWSVQQPRQPFLCEAAADAADLDDRVTNAPGNLDSGESLGQQQHRLSSAREASWSRGDFLQSLQLSTIRRSQHDRARSIGHGAPFSIPWPILY